MWPVVGGPPLGAETDLKVAQAQGLPTRPVGVGGFRHMPSGDWQEGEGNQENRRVVAFI